MTDTITHPGRLSDGPSTVETETMNTAAEALTIENDGIVSVGQAAQKVVKAAGQALTAKPEQTALRAWEGQAENDAFLAMIERAARDPNVDIDKMERLILMRERMQAQKAELEYDQAMSSAQQGMQPVRADANNPQTKSKYASHYALDTAIRPIYTKHGFSLSFDTADGAAEGCVRIVCKVAHPGGHRERPHIDMPADGKGAKGGEVMTKTHATGSAVTYGRRYLLGMIFNIAVGGDDDGNAAGSKANGPITEEQAAHLRKLIEETGTPIEKFCEFAKIDFVPELPAEHYDRAVHALELKRRKSA